MTLRDRVLNRGGVLIEPGMTIDAVGRLLSGFDESYEIDLYLAKALNVAGVIIRKDQQEGLWDGFTKPECDTEQSAWNEVIDQMREAGGEQSITVQALRKNTHAGTSFAIAVPGLRSIFGHLLEWFKKSEGAVNFISADMWDMGEKPAQRYCFTVQKTNKKLPIDLFTEQKAETEFWKKAFEQLLAYDGFEDSSDPNSYEDWHLMDALDPNSKTARIMLGLWKLGKITDPEVVRLCEQIQEAA